jgi:hypothetical protein
LFVLVVAIKPSPDNSEFVLVGGQELPTSRVIFAGLNRPDRIILCTVRPGCSDIVCLVELGFAERLDVGLVAMI